MTLQDKSIEMSLRSSALHNKLTRWMTLTFDKTIVTGIHFYVYDHCNIIKINKIFLYHYKDYFNNNNYYYNNIIIYTKKKCLVFIYIHV